MARGTTIGGAMCHSARARSLLTLVCALSLPLLAPGWAAAGSGSSPLHVDPASPVAKEYALPLPSARGAPPKSGRSGRLFGAGITPSKARTTDTTAAEPRRSRHAGTRAAGGGAAGGRTAGGRTRATAKGVPADYRVLRSGSGSGVLWMVLAAVVVVALGSAGGIALRRRR
jgi:hypothetical protein